MHGFKKPHLILNQYATTCASRYSVAVEALVFAKRYMIHALEASVIRNASSSISPAWFLSIACMAGSLRPLILFLCRFLFLFCGYITATLKWEPVTRMLFEWQATYFKRDFNLISFARLPSVYFSHWTTSMGMHLPRIGSMLWALLIFPFSISEQIFRPVIWISLHAANNRSVNLSILRKVTSFPSGKRPPNGSPRSIVLQSQPPKWKVLRHFPCHNSGPRTTMAIL